MNTLRLAMAASLGLFLVRLHIARGIGFGDAEALYVSYGLHPQPAYLDHPGLIGALARWLGDETSAPSAYAVHVFTSILAAFVPWVGGLAARAAGADWPGAARTVLALLFVPELCIGLFGLTPDLPLALAWLATLGLAALALRRPPAGFETLLLTLGAGAMLGFACLSKVSGVLLGLALLATLLGRSERARLKTLAPWAALVLALILFAPVVRWEAARGFPMLRHRLVDTQLEAGVSARNVLVLVGGQLLYVTPFFLIGAYHVARDLWRSVGRDPVSTLLGWCALLPAVVLGLLSIWSKVAEPHWIAPAYLALAVHAGRVDVISRRVKLGALLTGAAAVLLAWVWIKTSLPMRALGSRYRPRYDLANDLYAWGPGRRLLEQSVRESMLETQQIPVVVGPHWVICAQAQAALGHRVRVGCHSPQRDDFDDWLPRPNWSQARVLLFVTDDRFPVDAAREFNDRVVRGMGQAEVIRDRRVVRTIRVTRLEKISDVALSR